MKQCGWLLSVPAVLFLACPEVQARNPAASGKDTKSAKKMSKKKKQCLGRYDVMVKVLELEGEQKEKFLAQAKTNIHAVKEWHKANHAGMKKLRAAAKEAKKAGDEEKYKELYAKYKTLKNVKAKMYKANRAKTLALLNDDQKAAWAKYMFRSRAMRRYKGIDLSEEQKEKIEKLCEAAAKAMPKVKDKKSKKARAEVYKRLHADIAEDMLTASQREKLKKKMAEKRSKCKRVKVKAKTGKK